MSCLRPRKARRSRCKAREPVVLPRSLVREAHLSPRPHLVLAAQPLAQPPNRVCAKCAQPPVPPPTIRRPRLSRRPPRPRRRCDALSARQPRAHRRATPCRSASRTGSPELPSLSHVAPSGVAEHVLRRLGSHQSPRPFLRHALLSNQGPFPPPALPGFNSTTGLSATLAGPTRPSRAVGWRVPRHRKGFPCCAHSPLPNVPSPMPRRKRSVLVSLATRPLAAFPVWWAGRLPHHRFRGLLGVHARYGPQGR